MGKEKDKKCQEESREVEKEQIKENVTIPEYSSAVKGYVWL